MFSRHAVLRFRCAPILHLKSNKIEQYYRQEAFESLKRFAESGTYPGSIRRATPGDTMHSIYAPNTVYHSSERHYWRAVVDDPLVEEMMTVRVRFKDDVWVTTGWETRMHVVQVVVPRRSTVSFLMDELVVANCSPYLMQRPFSLAMDGKELDRSSTLDALGIDDLSRIDAIDQEADHLQHRADSAYRPKDWNRDEITAEDLTRSPYKEMGITAGQGLVPRYEGQPRALSAKSYGPVR